MPRHTSAIRIPQRPQDARHEHNVAKARRAQRLAAKATRRKSLTTIPNR